MSRPTVTVAFIARNEATNLPRALTSVRPIADEIIVVDTGSTDDTVAIAERFGAKVFHAAWQDDFSEAKNAALARATGDWILSLDADEAVTEEFIQRLPLYLANRDADAYMVMMLSYRNEGTVVQRTPSIRLFRNKPWHRFRFRVHESIMESIVERGGTVRPASLDILHFGYTPEEDKRKDRRQRNIRLLQLSLEQEPNRHDLWYYLGAEYMQLGEVTEAANCFRKRLAVLDDDMITGVAASSLAETLLSLDHPYDAWEVALTGYQRQQNVADCLIRMVQAALAEGDYVVADEFLRELRSIPADAPGLISREAWMIDDLNARLLWERGERDQALAVWERTVRAHPGQLAVADRWVRHLNLAFGLRAATVGLVQETGLVIVAAAVIGLLLRAGETALAATLAQKFADQRVPSIYFVHGLAHAGYWEEARQAGERAGLFGAVHFASTALEQGNEPVLRSAMSDLAVFFQTGLTALLAGKPVKLAEAESLFMLVDQWADAGQYELLRQAAPLLPGGPDVGEALAAKAIYRSGNLGMASEWAHRQTDQPAAMEVLGLCAFDRGQMDLAAEWLLRRVHAGPASVRVYHRCAMALAATGQRERAQLVLQEGRAQRPLSRLLAQPI